MQRCKPMTRLTGDKLQSSITPFQQQNKTFSQRFKSIIC